MKTIDQATLDQTLPSIDARALDAVTGGCGACGQDCANGAAQAGPQQQDPRRQNGMFGGMAGQAAG